MSLLALAALLSLSLTTLSVTPAVAIVPSPLPAPAGGGAVSETGNAPAIAYVTETARSLPSAWIAGAAGQEAKRLGPGDEPLLAPDGQWVAAGLSGAASTEAGPAVPSTRSSAGPPSTS